jgi:hypothetical protein
VLLDGRDSWFGRRMVPIFACATASALRASGFRWPTPPHRGSLRGRFPWQVYRFSARLGQEFRVPMLDSGHAFSRVRGMGSLKGR